MAKMVRRTLLLCVMLGLVSCQPQPPAETLKADPSALEQTYQEGRTAYEEGRYDQAAEKFALVVSADPAHLRALINWGAALSRGGEPAQAIPKFQQALTLDPNSAEAYYNWGVALERLGEDQQAVAKYEQALALKVELSTPALQRYLRRHQLRQRETEVGVPFSPPLTPQ
jgi:Flp pilus assembly protein TadD